MESTQSQYSSLTVGEHTYTVTVSRNIEGKHQSGQIQNFRVYPSVIEGKLGFNLLKVIEEVAERSVMALKGCWTICEKEPRLIIYRNSKYSDDKTVLQLIWQEAPISTIDKRYWQIEAELKGEKFEVIQAIGLFDPPPIPFRKKAKNKRTGDVPRPIPKSAQTPMALLASTEGASEAIEPEEAEISPVAAEPVTPKKKMASIKPPVSNKLSVLPETAEPKKMKEKVKSSRSKKSMSLAADRLFLGKQLPPGK